MTFNQQLLASFIGTFFGFLSAIVLFLLTFYIQRKLANNIFKKHLKREFRYDIKLMKEWIETVEKVLRKVTAKDKQIFYYIKYSDLARYFMDESFKLGLIYNLFSDEQVFALNKLVTHCSIGTEQYINNKIIAWRSCPAAEEDKQQKELLEAFEYQKDELSKFKKLLDELLEKLSGRKT